MKTKFIDKEMHYDGSQLRTQFAYREFGLLGDSVVSWVGSCNVSPEHMADGEDFLDKSEIRGSKMLHFLCELFYSDLKSGVPLQRLFASVVAEQIRGLNKTAVIDRTGDDLYYKEGKLSISVAAKGPLSCLIHFAINISNEGTPVKTSSLEDLNIQPNVLAQNVMEAFKLEKISIDEATCKVFPVN